MLAAMFSGRHHLDKDLDGNYFIDRDGTYFQYILSFLRDENDLPPVNVCEQVLKDAMFYGLQPLVDYLKSSPPLFAEFVVRENLRNKLDNYIGIKNTLIALARKQATEDSAVISVLRLVTSKNQPIPADLQFTKQVNKQYYRKFRIYDSFESCLGKYYIHVPAENVKCHPESTMDLVTGCLNHDLHQDGYKVVVKSEGILTEYNKLKTISPCPTQFHLLTSCHMFRFDWLDTDLCNLF